MIALTRRFWRLALFGCLSVIDLALTYWLLQTKPDQVFESNPVAVWWLDRFGWLGLAGFKLGVIVVVGGLLVLISRRRPILGRRLCGFACGIVLAIVFYSACLGLYLARNQDHQRYSRAQRHEIHLKHRVVVSKSYGSLLARVSQDYIHSRVNLDEALVLLSGSEKVKDPAWFQVLRKLYPGFTDRECLALSFIRYTMTGLEENPPLASRVARRIAGEFVMCFGTRRTGVPKDTVDLANWLLEVSHTSQVFAAL